MRLIDADALNDSMYHEAFETDSELQKWDSGCWIRYKMFENHLDNAPTIDAVPVVRGYSYEDDKTYSGPGTSNYICSVCGEMQGTWKKGLAQNQKFKFCPWCGAKMEDKPCR